MDFVTWELKDMPLKPMTVADLERQTHELAEELDTNPHTYFDKYGPKPEQLLQDSSPSLKTFGAIGKSRWKAPVGPALFSTPYVKTAKEIEKRADSLRAEVDEEAIAETFMAMLGYYVSRANELRMDKQGLLDVCKQWAIEAGGVANPPHISAMMMQKLGIPGFPSSPSELRFGMKNRDNRWTGGQEGQRSSYGNREGQRSSYGGQRSSYGNRGSHGNREQQRVPFSNRDGIDRGQLQADWRAKERSIGQMERNSRSGQSWMSRGNRGGRDGF